MRVKPHHSMIESIKVQNLLSFGPDAVALELKPLNVLIGTHGTGKSNLIDALKPHPAWDT